MNTVIFTAGLAAVTVVSLSLAAGIFIANYLSPLF